MKRTKKWQICLGALSLVLLLLGLLGLVLFPIVYPTMVRKNLVLSKNEKDESFSYSTQLFAKPPIKTNMKFYFFNVTNADEIKYEGQAPRVIEIGPYAFIEKEEKRYLEFSPDGERIFYQNYKQWTFDRNNSCETCEYDDLVTIPNPSNIGAAADIIDPQYRISALTQTVLSLGLLALGSYPFTTVKVNELLFDGYNDALLSAAHSDLITTLSIALNEGKSIIPIPFPDMPNLALFYGYNNSRDEEYWVHTGKGDIDKLGKVMSWGGVSSLPTEWWTTPESRAIRGSDSGTFNKMYLKPEDKIEMFHSFFCRSFTVSYDGRTDIEGIPSYSFVAGPDEFDTTLNANKGYRYRNIEKMNYFAEWPSCPQYNASNCKLKPQLEDCSDIENLCNDCCQRGFVDDTYLLPPGIFPMTCYPGRLQLSPFTLMWSPPHFLFSPPEVQSTVVGMAPDENRHRPMIYNHEPFSGMITQVFLRMQISIPVFPNYLISQNHNLPASIVPLLWEDTKGQLEAFVYSKYHLGFVLLPKLILGLSISFLGLALIFSAIIISIYCRKEKVIILS